MTEVPQEPDQIGQDTSPAPGGPNDPGASASNQNQADTPGYSGGGDGDPTLDTPPIRDPHDPAILDDGINAPPNAEEQLEDERLSQEPLYESDDEENA